MICPTCRQVGTLIKRQGTDRDRCGRCSNGNQPEYVLCRACGKQLCTKCFDKLSTAPPRPHPKFKPGPDDSSSI